mgnify:CR=1 FL=1
MSEKEKKIAEGISKLPDELKDRFLDKIEGAVMALDLTKPEEKKEDGS